MRSSSTPDVKGETRERDLSLDEPFAVDAERLKRFLVEELKLDPEVACRSLSEVERLKLTRDRVHRLITARDATVRQKFFSEYGLSQETLESAPEALRSELLSRLYDSMYSPDAKFESGLYWAAVARDKRLEVKAKAQEILAIQRKRALNVSIPKKLVATVQQRSTYLYYSELSGYFRSKYLEEIEKSDAYIPIAKDALKNRSDLRLPNLSEVGELMSNELLHPDALGQILAERRAHKQARGQLEAIPWWIWLIPIVLLILATAKLPYGYYTLLRFIVCIFAGVITITEWDEGIPGRSLSIAFGFVALLFNPLIPVFLQRGTWFYIDIGVAVFILRI